MDIGEKIAYIVRNFEENSKTSFARKIGTPSGRPGLIGDWIRGKSKPGHEYRVKICSAYADRGVTAEWLNSPGDDPPPTRSAPPEWAVGRRGTGLSQIDLRALCATRPARGIFFGVNSVLCDVEGVWPTIEQKARERGALMAEIACDACVDPDLLECLTNNKNRIPLDRLFEFIRLALHLNVGIVNIFNIEVDVGSASVTHYDGHGDITDIDIGGGAMFPATAVVDHEAIAREIPWAIMQAIIDIKFPNEGYLLRTYEALDSEGQRKLKAHAEDMYKLHGSTDRADESALEKQDTSQKSA
jgi:hypothetical protein